MDEKRLIGLIIELAKILKIKTIWVILNKLNHQNYPQCRNRVINNVADTKLFSHPQIIYIIACLNKKLFISNTIRSEKFVWE
jgi:7-cyano-7-deazaguanine synthase in queuosine biosynthesis